MSRGLPCIGQEALWITNKSIPLLQPLSLLLAFLCKNTQFSESSLLPSKRDCAILGSEYNLLKKEGIILTPLITTVQQVQGGTISVLREALQHFQVALGQTTTNTWNWRGKKPSWEINLYISEIPLKRQSHASKVIIQNFALSSLGWYLFKHKWNLSS